MDYTTLVLEHQLHSKYELHDILFEQMEMESQFILSCLENMTVTMEAVATKSQIGGFLQKIMDFIKKIFGAFSNTAKKIFQTNQAWMEENLPKLDKISFGGLEIDMVPFWTMFAAKSKKNEQFTTEIVGKLNTARSDTKYKNMQVLKDDLLDTYLDENGELAGGFKNHYRTGNAKGPLKTKKLSGDELKKLVLDEFRPFCLSYNTVILSSVKKTVDEFDHMARIVETEINKRDLKPTSESYCAVEGMLYKQTDLAYCENFVVLEADNSEEKKEEKPEEKSEGNKEQKADKTVKPSKVQITDHGDEKKAKMAKDAEASSDDDLLTSKNVLSVLQTLAAAQMTVAEEAFHAYLNAMKQILNARRGTSVKDDNKAAEEDKKNKKDKK